MNLRTTSMRTIPRRISLILHCPCAFHSSPSRRTPDRGPPYNVLFCGTDTFACSSLEALIGRPDLVRKIHVLTPPDTKQGWGAKRMKIAPVKHLALSRGLSHDHVPPDGLEGYKPPGFLYPLSRALLLTCSFGHLIPTSLLTRFPPSHLLNIHPSLLPSLRGAAPLQWTLARLLSHGGITVQTLQDGRFDAGRILGQERLCIPDGVDYVELEKIMAKKGAEVLLQVLEDLQARYESGIEQDEKMVSYATKVKKRHLEVKWKRWCARQIEARERGFGYLYPLTTTLYPASKSNFPPLPLSFSGTSIISSSALLQSDPTIFSLLTSKEPGSASYSPTLDLIIVKTLPPIGEEGATFLAIRNLTAKGKKSKKANEWWRAFKDRADVDGVVKFAPEKAS